jgi:inhibitor of cysteine peptidase
MFGRVIILGLVTVLAGLTCVGAARGATPLVIATDKNNGLTIKVAGAGSLQVRLPSNPTTGYQWTSTALRAGPLRETGTPTFVRSPSKLLGAGGTQVFTYRGVAPGTVHLSFNYARSWEHVTPAKHVALTVTVLP